MASRRPLQLLLLAVPVSTYPTAFDSMLFERDVFQGALRRAPEGSAHTIFDVGANDGTWSLRLVKRINKTVAQKRLRVSIFMLEPQENLSRRLQAVEAKLKSFGVDARYLPYAASKRNSTQQMSIQAGRRADTTVAQLTGGTSAAANISGLLRLVKVSTIDLAALVLAQLPAERSGGLAFLKLDTESYEYKLLPWLLTRGALWYAAAGRGDTGGWASFCSNDATDPEAVACPCHP